MLDMIEDLVNTGIVPHRFAKTTLVDKIKMNRDHNLVGFTIDIGNNEKLTGGVKDMKTGRVLRNVILPNISQLDFANDGQHLFFVQTDDQNRPNSVKRINLESGKQEVLFMDDDPTHYVDINMSKDKQFLFINSGTKEDSEVWVVDNRKDLPDIDV